MKTLKILALIPARMGSTRYPGKPLKKLLGKPLIGHVFDNIKEHPLLKTVSVATCDQEIYDYVKNIGGHCTMTSNEHERASDRCAEALLKIEKEYNIRYDIVVMVQGDEPMTHPNMITEAITPMLKNNNILVTNLMGKIKTKEEFSDPNCIKVVCNLKNEALYFSRQPIPTLSVSNHHSMSKQICVIPFQRDFLIKYTKLNPTPLEILESIDMMRILEHGLPVQMVETDYETHAVDTIEDMEKVEAILAKR